MTVSFLRRLAVVAAFTVAAALLQAVPMAARAETGSGVPGAPRIDEGSLAVGRDFACAIVSNGTVRCWGAGDQGQLAQGDVHHVGDDTGESTVTVPLPAPATSVMAMWETACALLDTGQVRCWGDAAYGALDTGNETDVGDQPGEQPVAIDLGPGRTAVAMAGGQQHACVILDTGQVRCWGYNSQGQLGQGSPVNNIGSAPGDKPVLVSLPRPAVAIAASWSSVCVVLDTGELRCWGSNYEGQLMQGNNLNYGDDVGEPGSLHVAIEPHTVSAIDGGGDHFCAVYDDHRPRCWGQSQYGELGLGRTEPFGDGPGETNVRTVDLPPGRTVFAVSAGMDNSCAILDDSTLRCWGRNQHGQLGQGNTNSIGDQAGESTVAVDLGAPVRAVGVGDGFVCAATDTGLRCWGANDRGQLGQGSALDFGSHAGEVPRLLPPINLGGLTVGRDTDGDGVRDAVDACPTVAGTGNGCAVATAAPEAKLKGSKVVIDTVLAKTKASAKCPKKAKVTVKTKTGKGKVTIVKLLKAKTAIGGCRVKGKVKLPAKPKKSAKVKVTISGKKLKTKHLVAVRP